MFLTSGESMVNHSSFKEFEHLFKQPHTQANKKMLILIATAVINNDQDVLKAIKDKYPQFLAYTLKQLQEVFNEQIK